MFEHGFEFRRKAGYQGELGLQHLKFDHHVAEKLASRGVGERAVVRQLMNLADVVQKSAGEEKVAIDLRIIPAHQIAGAAKRDHVIEQAANEGVVQGLGGGSVAIGGGNFRIGHESFEQ